MNFIGETCISNMYLKYHCANLSMDEAKCNIQKYEESYMIKISLTSM